MKLRFGIFQHIFRNIQERCEVGQKRYVAFSYFLLTRQEWIARQADRPNRSAIRAERDESGLYRLVSSITKRTKAAAPDVPADRTSSDYWLWHHRLGHTSAATMRKVRKDGGDNFTLWTAKDEKTNSKRLCAICALSKATRTKRKTKNVRRLYSKSREHLDALEPFESVSCDICKVTHP